MQFNRYLFGAFFVVVLAVYHRPWLGCAAQKLLVTSYLFYAAWDPVFIVLVWFSTFVDWGAARAIAASRTTSRRRALLIASVIVNIGVLAYFRYGGFVLANLVAVLHAIGVDYQPAPFDIVPIGIDLIEPEIADPLLVTDAIKMH